VLNLSYSDTHLYAPWLDNTLTAVFYPTVGALVASRRPENPVGWLLCLYGVAISISYFCAEYAIYALLAEPNSLPAADALVWVASWMLPIIIGLPAFLYLLFPTGRLPSRRWRWVAWSTGALVLAGVITSAFSSGALLGTLGPIRNPLGIEGFTGVYKALLYITSTVALGAVVLSVFVRLRHSIGVERQQIKWFAYAAAAYASAGILAYIIPSVIDTPLWFERVGFALNIAFIPAIPIAIGIAILRYRLYDIDILINRTLVYGSLTLMLALVFFGGVTSTQVVFTALSGQEQLPQLAIVVSTLVIAALFTPLRRRIQSFIDRRFYRRKYDARKTLEAFSAQLRDETYLNALSEDLVEVVRETMQPEHVSLWLCPDTLWKGEQAV
ncbi:MAG TPA: hypothetical protein VKA73_16350, partial [Rubrobacter sp.]|nr:hypothetical protein [Rubrobacter sp.]